MFPGCYVQLDSHIGLSGCIILLYSHFTQQARSTDLTLSQTSPGYKCLQYKSFENTVGKGEIAHDEKFLLLPQFFYPVGELFAIFIKF